jgi:hypothetical protein
MEECKMATVGDILTAPEVGWKRYDDNDPNLKYSGSFHHYANTVGSIAYGGTYTQGDKISCRFNFRGTKLRLIGVNPSTGYTPDGAITIDGVQVAIFNQKGVGDNHFNFINADIQGLLNKEHTVVITCGSAVLGIDAIDIDEDGELRPYTPISSPTNLTAIEGDSQVTLSWNAVEGAAGYNVKRSTAAGGPYTTIATKVTGTTYADKAVTNGITYYYVVTAGDGSGNESANSNEASATPQAPSGHGLLRITMNDSSEREYRLSTGEIESFIKWYDRTVGTGNTCYSFDDIVDLSKEYLSFDKIISFKVIPLKD